MINNNSINKTDSLRSTNQAEEITT